MTSENGLNIINEVFTNEGVKEEEELPLPMDTKIEEETIVASSKESTKIEKFENVDEKVDKENYTEPLLDQSFIIEGKRSRKPTLRLEITESISAKKELSIPQGNGKPLGEIEYINYQISHASTDALTRMRNICFGRRGHKATIRKYLREFKGFEFNSNSNEYQKHLNNLIKLKKDELRSISNILGLPLTGRNTDHAERILNFLIKPIDEGKKISGKKSIVRNKKKRSNNSKESIDTDQESEKVQIENGKDEHGSDYHFKPGKKSSNKRPSNEENSTNIKRKKVISKSKENQETIQTTNENDNSIENTKILSTDSIEDMI